MDSMSAQAHTDRRTRHQRTWARHLASLVCSVAAVAASACAHGRRPGSYLPVGASAQYGDATNAGVTRLIREPANAAIARVRAALQAAGYAVERLSGRGLRLRTAARGIGGDTTIVVTAELIP